MDSIDYPGWIDTKDYVDIGHIVYDTARDLFSKCGCQNDYCIQSVENNYVVFGLENRVLFSPLDGFCVERCHSTEGFLEKWDALHTGISQ